MQTATEYRNLNQHISYPFTDDASRTSSAAVVLPQDWLVDACVCVRSGGPRLYIRLYDAADATVVVADSDTGADVAYGAIPEAGDVIRLYDLSALQRPAGVLVLGDEAWRPASDLEFDYSATALCASCMVSSAVPGVSALLDPAGNGVTGAVDVIGAQGIRVTSRTDVSGRNRIRVDVIGYRPGGCLDPDPPIRQIRVINEYCTAILGSPEGSTRSTLQITPAPGFSLDDTCPESSIPDVNGNTESTDPCDPGAEPEPEPCVGSSQFLIPIIGGQLFVTTPSAIDGLNPFAVETVTVAGQTRTLAGISAGNTSPEAISRRLSDITNILSADFGKLRIYIRGAV